MTCIYIESQRNDDQVDEESNELAYQGNSDEFVAEIMSNLSKYQYKQSEFATDIAVDADDNEAQT